MNKQDILQLVNRHESGCSLEQPFYTDQRIFDIEWEHIWKKYWLFAGTTADIPKPGDYFTYNLQNDSIIVIRGNRGEVHAHYNTCRHRGSLICIEDHGNAPKLICPYHQWVYDKDGSLLKARLMPDDFDKSSYGLHPVHVQVVSGFIFISLSDDPPSLSQLIEDYTPFLDPYKIDKAKVAARKKYVLRTNWKLIAENFRECYHCGPAHPEYCNAVIGANLRESVDEVLSERRIEWKNKGLAIDDVNFKDDSFHFAVRYPLRPGVMSYSLDGKAVSVPMGDHKDFDAGVLGLVVYPNFWMDAVSDYMWTMRLTAISPSTTEIDLTWLVDNRAVEGVDYSVDRLVEFWKITGEQDWQLCENNFKGVESSHYQPGPYAPIESEVSKFVDWCIERLKEGMGEKRLTVRPE
jgi:phenylpropionate dioxygenase-like ring-hydroxylating dioxygenase large terminal subunit